ncbi:fimbria/pilus outer membrane usher protein [Rahnella sp. PCH160]|uniref:fimbria/pilus outer membrane usher protein n=1 Tax=Rahnella sp. PCH160 TaxID=3447928 RepID=UPI0039FB91DF
MSLMEKVGNLQGVDTSVLEKGSEMIAGNYPVILLINNEETGQVSQIFQLAEGSVQPVFTAAQLCAWGITPDRSPEGPHPLSAFVDDARFNYDAGSEQLSLTVPQARYSTVSGDIAPEQNWVAGLNAARLNYNLNLQRNTGSQSQQIDTASSTLNSGINLGNWRLRNDGYFNYSSEAGSHYQSSASYITRDIAALKSTFRGGDFFTNGKIFSSVSLRGITLYSSEEMRPDNQRFYMPDISGTARTNATVVIRQNGFVIDQRRVTPGPFLIKDLHSATSSGDLDITVIESDGSTQHFTQAFNAIAALLPPGVFNYEISAGRYRNSTTSGTTLVPKIYQASAFYGLSNTFTLLAGQQMATQGNFRYQNSGGGLGANIPVIGGLSLLLKRSKSQTVNSQKAQQGKQLETLFVRTVDETQSTLSLSWKHKYSQNYQEVGDAISAAQRSPAGIRYRDQYNAQLDQSIGAMTVMLRYTEDQRGDGSRQRSSRVGLSVSRWQSQFQVYYTHQRRLKGVTDNSLTFNVVIPLGESQMQHVGYNSLTDSRNGTQQTASVNGSLMADDQLSYDVSLSGQGSQKTSQISGDYSGSAGIVSAGISQGRGYQQTSLGMEGGVLVHHHGVTFSQPLGDTVVLVHTPQTRGLKIKNSENVSTDRWGNAVIPYAVPYRANDVELDPESLDRHIDASSTVKRVIPTHGAVIEAEFNARRHDRRFAKLLDKKEHPLPFGVEIQDAAHARIGTGGAAGILLADFSHARWPLAVTLNGHMLCHIPRSAPPGPPSDTSTLWKLSCS